MILPHTKLYGGVKRFFELGEVFLQQEIEFLIFTPDGFSPTWYEGNVRTLKLSTSDSYEFDAVFITELQYLQHLMKLKTKRRILYFVRPRDNLKVLKKYPEVEVFANSTNGYEVAKDKFGITAFKAFGGINIHTYTPKQLVRKEVSEPVTVLTYGRIVEKSKGTKLVVKACEKLMKKGYRIKLLLFDTPVSAKAEHAINRFATKVPFEFVVNHPVNKNVDLFHRGDIFVAAETKTGYSNTAAEAMASGIPVIGTASGTKHFLFDHETGLVVKRNVRNIRNALENLINDPALSEKLAINGRKKIEEFSWESLASKILEYLKLPRIQEIPSKKSFWNLFKV